MILRRLLVGPLLALSIGGVAACLTSACGAASVGAPDGHDAAGVDASAAREAGAARDAGPALTPPAGQGCRASPAAFCADFDEETLEAGWNKAAPNLRRDTTRSTSKPSSLLIVAPPPSSVVADGWSLATGLSGTSRRIDLAFDILRDSLSVSSAFTCAHMFVGDLPSFVVLVVEVAFRADQGRITVKARGAPKELVFTFEAPEPQVFHRFTMQIDASVDPPRLRATFGGVPALDAELPALATFTRAELELGFLRADKPFQWRLHLDDVTFDYR